MARARGLPGRREARSLRLYCSAEAPFSIEKGAIVAGVGKEGVRRVPVDDEYRMRPQDLERAIEEDRARGFWPFCVVATLGTTSSTSVDPVGEIAEICRKAGVWLHVDAAYGGAVAIAPEYRGLLAGWEQADSIVVNPHKWLFTPLDASLLLSRRMDQLRAAFSLVPEYLRTLLRPFHLALVDEADSILIDEARIPLVISGLTEAGATDAAEVGRGADVSSPARIFRPTRPGPPSP